MANAARTDIGFQGGQVLALRVADDAYEALLAALTDAKSERWHSIESDEERVKVDLSQVVYTRREQGDSKVGF